MFLWQIYGVRNKSVPHVFLSDFNQIWSLLTDFRGSPRLYQISCVPSNGIRADAYGRTDRTDMTEAHVPFSRLWDLMRPYGIAPYDQRMILSSECTLKHASERRI